MEYLQNLHTHSTFCDGADKPEEMVLEAINQGFDSIGFSGHSHMFYNNECGMTVEGQEAYKKEVRRLAKVYKDKLAIYLGLEYDMFSDLDTSDFDYIIGSVHYFHINGEYIPFDRAADKVEAIIHKYFADDGMQYAKAYYETLSALPDYVNADIIGHFDLITKHHDTRIFFDENTKEYENYALEAVSNLKGRIPFFEVNTGAISRGYRKTPYPAPFLVKALKENGFRAVISSDCHNRFKLKQSFDDAEELLRSCGFKEVYVLKENGFEPIPLK